MNVKLKYRRVDYYALGAKALNVIVRFPISLYRVLISPVLASVIGPACRFEPSCSRYADEAIARHGLIVGGLLAFRRLARCRPGGGWGFDPVPHDRGPATSISDRS